MSLRRCSGPVAFALAAALALGPLACARSTPSSRPVEPADMATAQVEVVHVSVPEAGAGEIDHERVFSQLPPEVIQAVIRASYGQLTSCYEAHLPASPSLQDGVQITFSIASDGGVSEARATQASVSNEIADCVAAAFARMRFPRQEQSVTVSYPILFAPG